MKRADRIRINWRNQIAQLEPYLSGRGGIVHVCGSKEAACNSFVKLIRQSVEQVCSGLSVQLTPDDPATRSPFDIVRKLETKLGVFAELSQPVQIFSQLQAGGDISIANVNVGVDGNVDSHMSLGQQYPDARKIVERTAEWGSRGRICLLLYNWHIMPKDTIKWFEHNLWSEGLSEQTAEGLLLVCADESDNTSIHQELFSWTPSCSVYLPPCYQGTERSHALDDIADQLQQALKIDTEQAYARADSIIITGNSPSMVYNAVALHKLAAEARK